MQAAFRPQVARRRDEVAAPSPIGRSALQLMGEFRASKSKEMKANERKIAFISFHKFLEFGLFKGLQAKKIKKSGSFRTLVSGCVRTPSWRHFLTSMFPAAILERQSHQRDDL
jgi:hypothetical protein